VLKAYSQRLGRASGNRSLAVRRFDGTYPEI